MRRICVLPADKRDLAKQLIPDGGWDSPLTSDGENITHYYCNWLDPSELNVRLMDTVGVWMKIKDEESTLDILKLHDPPLEKINE